MTRSSSVGFTLVELLVVMLFIGLGASVAVPSLIRTTASRSANTEITRLLRGARHAAARRGVPVSVVLDVATGTYSVLHTGEDGEEAVVAQGRISGHVGARAHATERRWLQLNFDPSGPARGDTVLAYGQGETVRISVDTWTGRVQELPER